VTGSNSIALKSNYTEIILNYTEIIFNYTEIGLIFHDFKLISHARNLNYTKIVSNYSEIVSNYTETIYVSQAPNFKLCMHHLITGKIKLITFVLNLKYMPVNNVIYELNIRAMKNLFIIRLILTISLLVLLSDSYCQLTISTALTPTQLAQNIFAGSGITISNVIYSGSLGGTNSQIGSFTNASNAYLGLDSGIVLSSGYVPHLSQHGDSLGIMSDAINSNAHDSDLASEEGIPLSATYDACVLQFDFIPSGDTVSFRYVFGSEEYPCWVCDQYDDAMGIFLSGPGITDPYSRAGVNIALIPGTNYPISVNTVNNGRIGSRVTGNDCPAYGLNYSSYYVNNLADSDIVLGGMTKVLTASHSVTPFKTYHMKIAICDTYNGMYDSSVLLGASSLNANGINEIKDKFNISVYPSPSANSLTIEGPQSDIIEISNIQGQLIKTFTAIGNKTNIDVSALPSGVYVVQVKTEKGVAVSKFVKE